MPIIDFFKEAKTICVIGLAKNTGKTVTLKTLLGELHAAKRSFGVTSIGRDGEAFDAIDSTIKKPLIYLPAGHYVATADSLIEKSNAALDILQVTDFRTPLGTIVIGKVLQGGRLEVAGPSTVKGMKIVCDMMRGCGAELVCVDGAINRKAVASAPVCDATILATGAILGTNINMVVNETKDHIQLLTIPVIEDPQIHHMARTTAGTLFIGCDYRVTPCDMRTILNNGRFIAHTLTDDIRYVLFRKSLVESVIDDILSISKVRQLTLIVDDSTKLFVAPKKLLLYQKQGISIRVLHPISVIGVTVNPVAPHRHHFDADLFVSMMQQALPDIPVVDVMHPQYV